MTGKKYDEPFLMSQRDIADSEGYSCHGSYRTGIFSFFWDKIFDGVTNYYRNKRQKKQQASSLERGVDDIYSSQDSDSDASKPEE